MTQDRINLKSESMPKSGWAIMVGYTDGSCQYLKRDLDGTGYIYDDLDEAARVAFKRKRLAPSDKIFLVPVTVELNEFELTEIL